MKSEYFQASISGTILVAILLFLFGLILGASIQGVWDKSLGDTIAVVIAFATFSTGVYHFYSQNKHNRMSVKPHLQFDIKTDGGDENQSDYKITYSISNYGLGPAIITAIHLTIKNQSINSSNEAAVYWRSLLLQEAPQFLNNGGNTYLNSNDAIDKKQSITLHNASELAVRIWQMVDLVIEYKSHYDETFVLNCSA